MCNTSANENNKHRVFATVTENKVNELILIQQSTKTKTISESVKIHEP